MFLIKIIRCRKGQSLTEAALIMPLIVFFLFTVMWFGKIMLTWQQIAGAARYGTDMIAYTPFSENYIKRDIIDYLCNANTIGRILDEKNLVVNVEIYDMAKIDFSLTIDNLQNFNISDIVDNVKGILPVEQDYSSVEIIYYFDAPFVFKAFGKDKIKIRSKARVLAGSGSAGQKERG
jgi:hypothetical protein